MSDGLINKTISQDKINDKPDAERKAETLRYITAGNATFTVVSTKIDKRYTYKVMHRKTDKSEYRYIVQVMHGNENDKDKSFHYLGLFYKDTGNGQWLGEDMATRMFRALLKILFVESEAWPKSCLFYKSGKCAHCGRKLTVPQSIEKGIGPECEKYI